MGLLNSLIEQAKNPRGFTGKIMLKIMNSTHSQKMIWGLSKIDMNENSIVLDIGCGGGKMIKLLSAKIKHGKIYGIDYSDEAVSASSKENQTDIQNGKVIVKKASVSSIPFADHFFDMAFAFQTHYFWPDLENDIKEVNRVLKIKAQFVLVAEIYKINYHMKKYHDQKALKDLFLKCGFSDVRIFETKQDLCVAGIK